MINLLQLSFPLALFISSSFRFRRASSDLYSGNSIKKFSYSSSSILHTSDQLTPSAEVKGHTA